jgi:hypothetical protein
MKTFLGFLAVFIGINAILWFGTLIIDTYQWIAEALILTGITGLLAAWLRYSFRSDK